MATDAFTDTDGVLLTAHGANWADNNSPFVITSNMVRGNVTNFECGARWTTDTPNVNQYTQITLAALTSSSSFIGPGVRLASGGAATYYGYYASSGNRYFFKIVAGVYTDLQTPAGSGAALNDVLRLEVNGTTLTPLRNGVLDSAFTSHTDSSISTGLLGLVGFSNSTNTRGDDWSGNSLVAVLEQEGFRFRNDNGSEITATWRQTQDTNDSVAVSTVERIRMLINTTGDAVAQGYQLEARKAGSLDWRKVQ